MNGDIIVSALHMLYKFYRKRDFWITTEVLVEGQFTVCKNELAALRVNLNCVSKGWTCPEVGRLLHTTKEQ